MNINTLTPHEAMARMGSRTTEAEATAMIALLRQSVWTDTDEIPFGDWLNFIQLAVIAAAN